MRYAYLAALAVSWPAMLLLARRLRLGISGDVLARSIALTVPPFLAFDAIGAWRGWFASSPRLNSAIFPPGIPLEEPVLLAFLVLIALVLEAVARRRLG